MLFEGTNMRHLIIMVLAALLLTGCYEYPSTEEIDGDIAILEKEINSAKANAEKYAGGLLSMLANVHLETLKSTKSMLEQKKKGFQRYIPISYTVDGKEYSPPANKDKLLEELTTDIDSAKAELTKAELESSKYGGGLLGVLSLTQVATAQNSLAFLNQRRLLLKYDIPYYNIVPTSQRDREPDFKPTPGEDVDKF